MNNVGSRVRIEVSKLIRRKTGGVTLQRRQDSKCPLFDFTSCWPSTLHLPRATMTTFTLLLLFLFCFAVFVLVAFACSSCLGHGLRRRADGKSTLPTTYGLQYAQSMGQGAHGGYSEHIELEDMLERWKQTQEGD